MLPTRRLHNPIVHYVITLGGVALMFFLRLLLQPVVEYRQPYIFFYFVTALSAWRFGWRPAALVTVVSGALAFWAFVPPVMAFGETHIGDKIGLLVFFILAGSFIALIEQTRRAAGRARSAAELAGQNELEHKRTLDVLGKRDSQLQLVADIVPIGVVHCDAQRRFIFVNELYAQQRGVRPDDCIGKHIWDVIGREAYDAFKEYVDAVLEGRPVEFEVQVPYSNMGPRFVHCAYVPEFDAARRVCGFVCAISVVTERRTDEEALRASEARLRSAMDAGKLGAWEWDIVKGHVTWSERIYTFHGIKPGEYDGTVESFAKLIHPEDSSRVLEAIRSALEGRSSYEIEFRTLRPDGSVRWLATSARVIFNKDGKPERMLGGTIDLTERKEIELALREAQSQLSRQAEQLERLVQQRTAELEHTLQSVESLCYTIAHDLRAPLRAMQGFARALAEDFGDAIDSEAANYTQRIMRAAMRMDALITDLLAYGRLGTADITAHPVEIDTALDAFLTDYAEEVKARHATICVERLMPIVMANRTLLGQVIANLLLNAMKFVAPGTVPQIRVYAESRCERVRLSIEDNGIGIAAEHGAKLFQVFQRLHGPEQYAGTGIGLAIVKKAVERMDGNVGFNSTPGKGSTFWIELPSGANSNPKIQTPSTKEAPSPKTQ